MLKVVVQRGDQRVVILMLLLKLRVVVVVVVLIFPNPARILGADSAIQSGEEKEGPGERVAVGLGPTVYLLPG
jgi:hypothetical protein